MYNRITKYFLLLRGRTYMIDFLKKIDIKILNFINTHLKNNFLDKMMPFITVFGDMGFIWIVLAVVLMTKQKYREMGVVIILTLMFTTIIGECIIKNLVKRKRPFTNNIKENALLIRKPITYSFPSGHTASSFAVAGVFIAYESSLSIYITILAVLITFSRLYLNVHYPSDVLFGGILGMLCSFIITYLCLRVM